MHTYTQTRTHRKPKCKREEGEDRKRKSKQTKKQRGTNIVGGFFWLIPSLNVCFIGERRASILGFFFFLCVCVMGGQNELSQSALISWSV